MMINQNMDLINKNKKMNFKFKIKLCILGMENKEIYMDILSIVKDKLVCEEKIKIMEQQIIKYKDDISLFSRVLSDFETIFVKDKNYEYDDINIFDEDSSFYEKDIIDKIKKRKEKAEIWIDNIKNELKNAIKIKKIIDFLSLKIKEQEQNI